jgi:ABC-type thiamin/hydroxymethylpyrimidine transport system permease subunit
MFRYSLHYHQSELVCPLLQTACCYAAVVYGHYSSFVLKYTRYNFAFTEFTIIYTTVKIIHVALLCSMLKALKGYD